MDRINVRNEWGSTSLAQRIRASQSNNTYLNSQEALNIAATEPARQDWMSLQSGSGAERPVTSQTTTDLMVLM